MGRKRKKKVAAGEYYSVYIPKDIDPQVLEYLKRQPYLSKAIFKILTEYIVEGKKNIENKKVSSQNVEIDMNSINDNLKRTIESTIRNVLKDMNFEGIKKKSLSENLEDNDDETINGVSKSDLEFYGKLF